MARNQKKGNGSVYQIVEMAAVTLIFSLYHFFKLKREYARRRFS